MKLNGFIAKCFFVFVFFASRQGMCFPAHMKSWGSDQIRSAKARSMVLEASKQKLKKVIIAVIDTGVDIEHPDLKKSIWSNEGEVGLDCLGNRKENNGIDDDQNGFIDDVHGWNFADQNNKLEDEHGHGTHISGIIAADGRYQGVSPYVQIMVLKYFNPVLKGNQNLIGSIRAIHYATKMGAQIINYSGGGPETNLSELKAIREAQEKGVLFVAAAGNEKSNSDVQGFFPADYELDNIISVTAIDWKKKILPSSNFGRKTVHLAAPGQDILSTLPNGQYGYMSGTSQATAFVTGIAGFLLSQSIGIKNAVDLIPFLIQSGVFEKNLKNQTRFEVRVDSLRALSMKREDQNVFGVFLNPALDRNSQGNKIANQIASVLKEMGL